MIWERLVEDNRSRLDPDDFENLFKGLAEPSAEDREFTERVLAAFEKRLRESLDEETSERLRREFSSLPND